MSAANDYARVERAIRYLDDCFPERPSLDQLARSAGLSPFHFQRLFKRWAGVSPKRFLQFLTLEHAKGLLARSTSVLDTAYQVGLSGPSRLHDLFVGIDAVTPGEYRTRGKGLTIRYGAHPSPFGECFVAATDRGICALSFLDRPGRMQEAVGDLRREWAGATLREEPRATDALVRSVFAGIGDPPVALLLRGTNFQIKVWHALLRVPPGSAVSYEELATLAGRPGATRAVAGAVARNRIAFLIPCHRVIRKSAAFGDYRWGAARKRAILGWEQARLG